MICHDPLSWIDRFSDWDDNVFGVKNKHDPVGRIWPPICVHTLEYGAELVYENVPLHALHAASEGYGSHNEQEAAKLVIESGVGHIGSGRGCSASMYCLHCNPAVVVG